MKLNITIIFIILISIFSHGQKIMKYPMTEQDEIFDNYFGDEIKDPYRWLEDANSKKTNKWIQDQDDFTKDYLGKNDLESLIFRRLLRLSYIEYNPVIKKGKYYFIYKYSGFESTPSLYFKEKINDNAKLIIDPAEFKENKSQLLSINSFEVSKDNKFLSFSISNYGSDWNQIRVIDLKTKKPIDDKIIDVKFSNIEWYKNGFFYVKCDTVSQDNRLTAENKNPKLYYHKIGDQVNNDLLVYDSPLKELNKWFNYKVTSDERYLIINDFTKSENKDIYKSVMYSFLDSFPVLNLCTFIMIPKSSTNKFVVIDNIGDSFLVKTDQAAQTGKLLLYDPKKGVNNGIEIIHPYKNVLMHVSYANQKIICLYYLNGHYSASFFDVEGKVLLNLKFPEGSTVSGFNAISTDKETIFYTSSFYFPAIIRKMDLSTLKYELLGTTQIEFDHSKYETHYVEFKSDDSIAVPMYITYKKGIKLNGNNPTLLYGYGGFGVSLTPFFNPSFIVWMENGGILAVPSLRGGGEKGSNWHLEGKREKKLNGFNDFICAAKYLISNDYTNSAKLAIQGSSNGGLLVGVALTQHPELFKAAIPEMGVMDMLRYDKFTIGSQNVSEYGSSSKEDDYKNLIKYSPLHNIVDGVKYPATMAVTADNDDRVPPFHTYKFIATLQAKSEKNNPYLIYLIKNSGHSGANTIDEKIKTKTSILGFLFDILKVKVSSVWSDNEE